MASEPTDDASRMSTSPTHTDGEWFCSHASFDKWCLACAHKEIKRLEAALIRKDRALAAQTHTIEKLEM